MRAARSKSRMPSAGPEIPVRLRREVERRRLAVRAALPGCRSARLADRHAGVRQVRQHAATGPRSAARRFAICCSSSLISSRASLRRRAQRRRCPRRRACAGRSPRSRLFCAAQRLELLRQRAAALAQQASSRTRLETAAPPRDCRPSPDHRSVRERGPGSSMAPIVAAAPAAGTSPGEAAIHPC